MLVLALLRATDAMHRCLCSVLRVAFQHAALISHCPAHILLCRTGCRRRRLRFIISHNSRISSSGRHVAHEAVGPRGDLRGGPLRARRASGSAGLRVDPTVFGARPYFACCGYVSVGLSVLPAVLCLQCAGCASARPRSSSPLTLLLQLCFIEPRLPRSVLPCARGQVWNLQRALEKKRDPLTQLLFADALRAQVRSRPDSSTFSSFCALLLLLFPGLQVLPA